MYSVYSFKEITKSNVPTKSKSKTLKHSGLVYFVKVNPILRLDWKLFIFIFIKLFYVKI